MERPNSRTENSSGALHVDAAGAVEGLIENKRWSFFKLSCARRSALCWLPTRLGVDFASAPLSPISNPNQSSRGDVTLR